MKRTLIALAIGGLLSCGTAHAQCCGTAPVKASKTMPTDTPASAQATASANDITVTLKVTGMTCEMCPKDVEKALKKVDGVKAAEVSLEKNQAVVTVDSAKVETEQLIAAVDKAGGDRHTFKAEKAAMFKCDSCDKTYDKAGSCCGAPTKKVK